MKRTIPFHPHDLRLLWRPSYQRRFCNSSRFQRPSSQPVKVYTIPRRRSRWTLLPSIILFAAFYSTFISEWSLEGDEDEDSKKKDDEKKPDDDEKSKKNDRQIKKKLRLVRKQRNTGKTAEVETQVTSLTGTDGISELGDENFPRINLSAPTSAEPVVIILPPIWQEKPDWIYANDEEYKLLQEFSKEASMKQKADLELRKHLITLLTSGGYRDFGKDSKIENLSRFTDYPVRKAPKNKAYCLQISENELAFGETEVEQRHVNFMNRHLDPGKTIRSILKAIRFYYELKMIYVKIRFNIDDPDLYRHIHEGGLMGTFQLRAAAGFEPSSFPSPKEAAIQSFLSRFWPESLPGAQEQSESTRPEVALQAQASGSQEPKPWWANIFVKIGRKPGAQSDFQATNLYFLRELRLNRDRDPKSLAFKSGNVVLSGLCTISGSDSTSVTLDYIAAYDLRSQTIRSCQLSVRRTSPLSIPYMPNSSIYDRVTEKRKKEVYGLGKASQQSQSPKDVSAAFSWPLPGAKDSKLQSKEETEKKSRRTGSSSDSKSTPQDKNSEKESDRIRHPDRVSKASSDLKLNQKLDWPKDDSLRDNGAKANPEAVSNKPKGSGADGRKGGPAGGKKSSSQDASHGGPAGGKKSSSEDASNTKK